MQRFVFIFFLVAVVFTQTVSARSILGAPNEVADPWFQNIASDWFISGNTRSLAPNPGNLPGNYFDPGRNSGDSAFLRTIVDDYGGLWNGSYDNKEIDFSMYAHIVGGGYVRVRFDWWLDENIPMPPLDPNAVGPTPDGYTDWYLASAPSNLPGDFTNRPDLIAPGEDPGWFTPDGSESFLLNIHRILDVNPRWISIEIEAGVDPLAPSGGEALITGIDFEARSVPAPTPLALLLLGGLLLPGFKRR